GGKFPSARARTHAVTAVVARATASGVAIEGPVVVDVGDIHVRDMGKRTIVEELAIAPVPTGEADSKIAAAIVDAAIEADMRSPVAGIPDEVVIHKSPVARGPEQSRFRGEHPCARHPVIAR